MAENKGSLVCRTQLKFPRRGGLHGREAAMLVKLGRSFDSNLVLECGAQQFNAKSIINLLSLEPDQSLEMTATAEGPDADRMILAIKEFFAGEFRSSSESPLLVADPARLH